MRLQLTFLQKTKSESAIALINESVKKISQFLPVEISELKLPDQFEPPEEPPGNAVFFLHDSGREMTSSEFAAFLKNLIHRSGKNRLVFWVGGPAGFPAFEIPSHQAIALSKMTYSHELARVMLCEQIYRALAIIHGHPYPK